MKDTSKPLNLTKQIIRFCQEYIIDLNGKQAVIRAGYSAKTAEVKASQLLSKVKVQEYIQELMKKREERTEITSDMVVQELAKIAFSDVREVYDETGRLLEPFELDDKAAASISSFKITSTSVGTKDNQEEKVVEEYKRYDKVKTLELLGKHFGLFIEKVETKVTGNTTVVNIVEDKRDDV